LCVNKNGHRLKIIDFGLARKFDPEQSLKILFGTPEFVAPEVISYDKVSYSTDMWSVGVICYVLLSGLSPFMGDNDLETFGNIHNADFDFDDESFVDISMEAKDFITKLLNKNINERLKSNECLDHPWLRTISSSTIALRPDTADKPDKIINTKNLRRYVIRRRWQKAVNALLALKRMGMNF
jgi:myosin-light-chain kinase